MEVTIQLDSPARLIELFGPADCNLRLLRDRLGIRISARHGNILISGHEKDVNKATEIIDKMQKHLLKHRLVTSDDMKLFLGRSTPDNYVRFEAPDRHTDELEPISDESESTSLAVFSHKKTIAASTKGQLKYVQTMLANDLTFCIGPAGTGKTYLAVAVAVSMLKRKQIRRIILARPAVEAGEKLGFLPGDLQAKVNPYLRPLFDALEDMMDFAQMKKFMALDVIEIIPLAFMRGRTLNESVIICDEAQNTSPLQMLMVLTRLGRGSKMIINGDITQIDLEKGAKSGLIEAIETLRRIKGIGFVELTQRDIVRHQLVQKIVLAYKKRNSNQETH